MILLIMGVALVPAGSVVSDTFLSLRRSELQSTGGPRETGYRMGPLLGSSLIMAHL